MKDCVVCASSPSQAPGPSMACCKLRNTRHRLLVCKLPTFGRGNADSESPRDSGTDTAGAWMSRPCAGRCVPGLTHCAPDVGRLYVDLQTRAGACEPSISDAVARHGPHQPHAHRSDAALDNASIHSRASCSVLPRKVNLLPPTCAATLVVGRQLQFGLTHGAADTDAPEGPQCARGRHALARRLPKTAYGRGMRQPGCT